jgi:hypothetical protein
MSRHQLGVRRPYPSSAKRTSSQKAIAERCQGTSIADHLFNQRLFWTASMPTRIWHTYSHNFLRARVRRCRLERLGYHPSSLSVLPPGTGPRLPILVMDTTSPWRMQQPVTPTSKLIKKMASATSSGVMNRFNCVCGITSTGQKKTGCRPLPQNQAKPLGSPI